MKALVIAAGEGKRLRESGYKGAKPLYNILGLSLLARILLSLREAGIKEVFVVIGYKGEEIKRRIGNGEIWGISVDYIFNGEWHLGNGVSVLAARDYLRNESSFILVMADHILEPRLLEIVSSFKPLENGLYVGADFKLDKIVDIEEATKLKVVDGRVTAIGKKINDFQAVDCGVFHVTPFIFEILERNKEKGVYSWSEAVQVLADNGKVWPVDIGECFWVDVDNREDAKRAEKFLLKGLPSDKDGVIARYLNRKISVNITRLLANTGVKPNHISFVSFLICLLSALFFGIGCNAYAGILAQIASILDGVDGELARLKFLRSRWGEILDAFLDRYGDGFIIIGMGTGVFLNNQAEIEILGVCLALALLGAPLSMLFKEKVKNIYNGQYLPRKEGVLANMLLGNRDGRLFLVMLAGVLDKPFGGLVALALTSHLLLFFRMVMARKYLQEI